MEILAIEGGDARGFLTAVLQGVKPQRRDRSGTFGAVNTKDAALLAELVVVKRMGRQHVNPGAGGWDCRAYRSAEPKCRPPYLTF
jgi:hypothetical protein